MPAIDYSKPAKEILWECLLKAARSIIKKKKIVLRDDEFDELVMDICLKAHDRVISRIDEWNHSYKLFNFVYWHVWSVSGDIVDRYLRNLKFKVDNVVSTSKIIDAETSMTVADTLDDRKTNLYRARRDTPRKLKATKNRQAQVQVLNRVAHEDYLDYCDCCEEFGIAPLSENDYLGQCDAVAHSCTRQGV